MALVGRDEAEDLLARLFLKASERPPRTATNIRGWLARVLKNEAVDSLRSKQRRQAREQRLPKPENPFTPHELLEKSEAQNLIHQALQELDEPNRLLLLMRYFQQLSPQEIAQNLNVSIPTVRVRLTRALGALRKRLRTKYGDQGIGYCFIATGQLPAAELSGGTSGVGRKQRFKNVQFGAVAGLGVVLGVASLVIWKSEDFSFDSGYGQEASSPVGNGSAFLDRESKASSELLLRKREAVAGVSLLELLDSNGIPIPDAKIVIFQGGLTIRVEADSENNGLYLLDPSIDDLAESESKVFILISSSGHTPLWEEMPDQENGIVSITLPRGEIVAGKVDLPYVNGSPPLYLTLGLKSMRPKIGSREFRWRDMLTNRQKNLVDDAFYSCLTRIGKDGEFHFEGLATDWSGPIRFFSSIYELEYARQDSGFQEIYLLGPSRQVYLSGKLRECIKGRVLPYGSRDPSPSVRLISAHSVGGPSQGKELVFDAETGEFMIFFAKLPVGNLMFLVEQDGVRGDMEVYRESHQLNLGEIVLPPRRQFIFRLEDVEGSPVPDIEIVAPSGAVLGVSNGEGLVQVIVPEFAKILWIKSEDWMPRRLIIENGEHQIKMQSRFGVELKFRMLEGEDAGFDSSAKSSAMIEVEISCQEGLFPKHPTDSEISTWYPYWGEIVADPKNKKVTALHGYFPLDEPLSLYGVNPKGTAKVKAWIDGVLVVEKNLELKQERKYHRVQVWVASLVEEGHGILTVVNSAGEPVSNALMVSKVRDGFEILGTTDSYGIFPLKGIYLGKEIMARKLGWESSRWKYIPDEMRSEGLILRLRKSRKVKVKLIAIDNLELSDQVSCRGVRLSDGLVFRATRIAPGRFLLEDCPLGEFKIEVKSSCWKFSTTCPAGVEGFSLAPFPDQKVVIDMSDLLHKRTRGESLEFLASFGSWNAKCLNENSENPEKLSFRMPFFEGEIFLLGEGDEDGFGSRIPLEVNRMNSVWRLAKEERE
jgi:RNA polymerase sigma-70 factor, ECF subfamily